MSLTNSDVVLAITQALARDHGALLMALVRRGVLSIDDLRWATDEANRTVADLSTDAGTDQFDFLGRYAPKAESPEDLKLRTTEGDDAVQLLVGAHAKCVMLLTSRVGALVLGVARCREIAKWFEEAATALEARQDTGQVIR